MMGKLAAVLLCLLLMSLHLAEAQVPLKIPRIGYLTVRSSPSVRDEIFKQALRDLGWIEGQNYTLEWRGASASMENLSARATELVRKWT